MKFTRTAAVVSASALVALANPAIASPPYQIDVGANTGPSTHTWNAVANEPFYFLIHHGPNKVPIACTTGTLAGTINAGPDSDGMDVGVIASSSWGTKPTPYNPCEGSGGLDFNLTQVSAWRLNFTGVATNALGDSVAGHVGNFTGRVTSKILGLCSYNLTGTADMVFRERVLKSVGPPALYGQELEINDTSGNVVLSSVSGCLGSVANGDEMDIHVTFDVTSPDGAININS